MIEGDRLLATMVALGHPHRLRIVAVLATRGRDYVSRLAREVGISRPLLHLHLQKLEDAGLVTSRFELSPDGKALKFFEVAAFSLLLSPEVVAQAVTTLTTPFPPNTD